MAEVVMAGETAVEPKKSGERAGAGFHRVTVTHVRHYTEKLFSFRTTRPQSLRFASGQFVMIGLMVEGRPLLRAYSFASAVYDEHLEFFSIKVPNGPLTSRLQHLKPGDELIVGLKPTGTLVVDNLRPGRRLLLLSTGTGFAPFASILRDPEIYDRFETVVAVEGCREVAELEFASSVVSEVKQHEFLGDLARDKLHFLPTVTREAFPRMGRIPALLAEGRLLEPEGLAPLSREDDRVMICGSPGALADIVALLTSRSFAEGSSGEPGDFVIEKAFAQR